MPKKDEHYVDAFPFIIQMHPMSKIPVVTTKVVGHLFNIPRPEISWHDYNSQRPDFGHLYRQ